jgi:hypothetical protein
MTLPARARALRFFAFLGLAVMTLLYARYRHDVRFLQEHCARSKALRKGRQPALARPSAVPGRTGEDISAIASRRWKRCYGMSLRDFVWLKFFMLIAGAKAEDVELALISTS